jgi:hypothetical protein
LRRAGRQRNIDQRAAEIQDALRADYLHAPAAVAGAYGAAARSAIRLISAYTAQIAELEEALAEHLTSTRTRRSSVPCQDWGRSPAPGCWASSVMTGPVLPAPSLARTTPARHPSPGHPGAAAWCWPATPATGAWPTRWTGGHSAPSPHHREPAPTTTSSAPAANPPPGPAPARQPLGWHPPHLPPPRTALRRNCRLAAPGNRRCLTPSSRGVSRPFRQAQITPY